MTTFRVHLKPPAASDLDEAVAWYEGQRAGLGLKLLDEATAVLERIGHVPLQFPVVHERIRRALLRRFPYGIFFVIDVSQISVLAVTHLRRDPRVWKSRGGPR